MSDSELAMSIGLIALFIAMVFIVSYQNEKEDY
jgi:hypothetical protein